jgi:hypothetical protein
MKKKRNAQVIKSISNLLGYIIWKSNGDGDDDDDWEAAEESAHGMGRRHECRYM